MLESCQGRGTSFVWSVRKYEVNGANIPGRPDYGASAGYGHPGARIVVRPTRLPLHVLALARRASTRSLRPGYKRPARMS